MKRNLQRHINLNRWLLAVWILLCGCMVSTALAYDHVAQVSSWNNHTATYSSMSSLATPPSYQFRSTSVYTSIVGTTTFTPLTDSPYSGGPSGPRRDPWDPNPGDNPIGEVDDPAPIGEPLVLLLLGLLYFVRIRKKRLSSLL